MGREKTCLHSESLSARLKEENIAKRKYKIIIAEYIENKITEKKLSNKPSNIKKAEIAQKKAKTFENTLKNKLIFH